MKTIKIANKKKTFLVTGGAGFIGSHLTEDLLKLGHKVIIIDDFSSSAIEKIDPRIKTYKTDVEDFDKVREIFKKEKPDFVYHLAGVINLRYQITNPLFVKAMDILGRTKIILDSCLVSNVKKIIFISSGGSIYENAKVIPTPQDYPAHPTSLYGLANVMVEKYIESYYEEYGLNFVILRLSNVYGPRQWESGIIPSIITKILKKEKPVIYGSGNQTRDFIYINDAIEALIMLAERGKNGIYNVGTGKEVSLNEIFKLVKYFLNVRISPIYKNSRDIEAKRSALDIKKIKKEFGWYSKTNIKGGLKKTIDWYKLNF
ncbi:MAG: NAD-dependent epimerase/dehydratase family protein [bacterium]|nr:NAD-dependent epimerase/dehydratase family protein [bacterium]